MISVRNVWWDSRGLEEWCDFSPVWVSWCSFRLPAWVNVFSQVQHLCAFSPVLVSRCSFRLPAWVNAFSQVLQLCAFSLWVRWCSFRCPARLKTFSQVPPVYVFSAVWVSRCSFRCPARVNAFSQVPHLCDFSPVWVSWCSFRLPAWVNTFSQVPHLKGFSPVWLSRCEWMHYHTSHTFWGPFSTVGAKMLLQMSSSSEYLLTVPTLTSVTLLHCGRANATLDCKLCEWILTGTTTACVVQSFLDTKICHKSDFL